MESIVVKCLEYDEDAEDAVVAPPNGKETEQLSLTVGVLPPGTRRLSPRQDTFFNSPLNELLQFLDVMVRQTDQFLGVSLRRSDPVFSSGPVTEPIPNHCLTAMTQYIIPGDGLFIPLLPALRP